VNVTANVRDFIKAREFLDQQSDRQPFKKSPASWGYVEVEDRLNNT
jgi:hypothetical protein